MITLLVAVIILYTLALSIHIKTKQSIQVALFEVICLITITITVFGIFSLMHVAQIIIYVTSALSIIFNIYQITIKKRSVKFSDVITPSLIIILFSVLFYYLAVRNNIFYIKDEVAAYGVSVKRMLYNNKLDRWGCLPTFAYFLTKINGFSEGMVFTSKWIFIWLCYCLPIANLKWDKWYLALIYGAVGYGVVTIINPEPMFLMDASVGIISGALCGYLAVNLKKSSAITLGLGLIILTLTKDMAGILFMLFVLGYILVNYLIMLSENKFVITRAWLIKVSLILVSVIVAIYMAHVTIGLPKVILKLLSFKNIALLVIFVLLIVGICIIAKKLIKDKVKLDDKYKIVIGVALLFLISMFIYKVVWKVILSFSYLQQKNFVYSLTKYFDKSYFGIRFMPLLGLLLIFVIGVCVLALNRKYYKYLISQFVVIITLAFVYGFIIAYIFTVQYSVLVSSMDGLERYMGSMAIMIILWLLSLMYAANDYWQNGRKQIICICLVSSLIIRCYPVYGETMFNIYNPTTISFKEWIRPDAESEANKLAMFTEEESRILFINQKDKDNKFGAGSEYWIEYYMVPRELGSALSSFNTDEDEAYKDFLTQYCTVDQLKTMISRSDYVYVLFTNQDFETMYGELFPVNSLKNGTLFKVNKEILVPIDTKEE